MGLTAVDDGVRTSEKNVLLLLSACQWGTNQMAGGLRVVRLFSHGQCTLMCARHIGNNGVSTCEMGHHNSCELHLSVI
jgi:hypothetical protein